jgi:hypothetical protein
MHLAIHHSFAGAAHPESSFESLNIFIPAVRLITLNSMFTWGSGYIEFLQHECAAFIARELEGEADFQSVLEKLSNEWVTFETFTIDMEGLSFLFGEVLGHVYGPQFATIEGSQLRPFLRNSELSDRLTALWSPSLSGDVGL